jgi:deoxyribodipyrimidine photolyase
MADQLINSLDLPGTLRHRILCRVVPPSDNTFDVTIKKKKSFILYLPTVVLRKRHNPAFALACRLANHYEVPVVVLCTVLDDQHLSRKPLSPVSMTARRLAFTLEALQSCTQEWEKHGAGVAVRLHGPGARTPHHLTLAHQALAVVSDEPFVEPFRTYLRKVVSTCQAAKVPCFSVDGSTTVPPKSKLNPSREQTVMGDICFSGAPGKAWVWAKQTEPDRKSQVNGTVKDGDMDAPDLMVKLPASFFLQVPSDDSDDDPWKRVMEVIPSRWKSNKDTPCPGQRPWAVEELVAILDLKDWVMTSWPGADTTIPPCRQTHGSSTAARERWQTFLNNRGGGGGLQHYAKRRNQIVLPHAVSRISCYLNLGILSIFDVVHDVWEAKSTRAGYSAGCQKYLDEVLKWREIGYVHTFALPGYHTAQAIPKWAHDYLQQQHQQQSSKSTYTYEQLESASTGDKTWNAMQGYLIETGELHNNARMTWGKTVVHWQASTVSSPEDILWQLCCLNDRFALDGLSPPSYAGILWCFGWSDKPSSRGSILSTKWASRYRTGPAGFEQAKESLHHDDYVIQRSSSDSTNPAPTKKARRDDDETATTKTQSKTILSFFSPVKLG